VAEAASYVFGVTAATDISERDWQRGDLQWFRSKATDTFGPLGPAIVTGLDPNDLLVQTRVNGEVRQSERTRDLIFNVEAIVSYVSRYVTLEPGDVIYTGTPRPPGHSTWATSSRWRSKASASCEICRRAGRVAVQRPTDTEIHPMTSRLPCGARLLPWPSHGVFRR